MVMSGECAVFNGFLRNLADSGEISVTHQHPLLEICTMVARIAVGDGDDRRPF